MASEVLELTTLQGLFDLERPTCDQPRLTNYLNHWFCLIRDGDGYYAYRKTTTEPWMPVKSLCRIMHYHILVRKGEGKVSSVPVFKIWKQNPGVRTYDAFIFDPTFIGERDGALNRFRGIKASQLTHQPSNNADLSEELLRPILHLLRDFLCNKA